MDDLDTLTQLQKCAESPLLQVWDGQQKDSINHHTSELALIKREYRRKEAYKHEHNTKRN